MAANKFFMLAITFTWMGGLFAIVLTLCYVLLERRERRATWESARFQASLYASLITFCVGLALHAYAAQHSVSMWVAIVWGMLAILFALRLVGVVAAGIRTGWHSPLHARRFGDDSARISREASRFSLGSSLSLVLLLVNAFILVWWGNTQLNAGEVALPLAEDKSGGSTSTAPVVQPTLRATESVVLSTSKEEPSTTSDLSKGLSNPGEVASAVLSPTSTLLEVLIPTPTPLTPDELSLTVRNPSGGNVRKEPSLNAEVLTVLMDGTLAPLLGRTADSQWYLIQLADGTTGWISIQVIELEAADNLIPVIAVN